MTELNVRIASTREAPTAGDNAHTTYGRRKSTESALCLFFCLFVFVCMGRERENVRRKEVCVWG